MRRGSLVEEQHFLNLTPYERKLDMNEQIQIDELRRELAEQKEKLGLLEEKCKLSEASTNTTCNKFMKVADDTMELVQKMSTVMDKVTKKYPVEPVDPLWSLN